MDKPKATARDFFLWFGAMLSLYLSVFAFIRLIFDYLNYLLPDTTRGYYFGDPYSSSISYEMASLIVLVPLFLVLMRIIRSDMAMDPSRADVWVRRWALVLTLFVAGATLAGDLITLLMYFFNGDATLRFLLKVLAVFLVAGGIFAHFMADLRGYYALNPGRARVLTWVVGAAVLASIVGGFFIVGTPWQARLFRYDEQKVNDLLMIQQQVVSYWQAKETLPPALTSLQDSISGFAVPNDPQSGQPYEYSRTSNLSFELCAQFNAPTRPNSQSIAYPVEPFFTEKGGTSDYWKHESGRTCFERTIDPDIYPPFKRQSKI